MQVNRIQNKVAISSLTLPVAILFATLSWVAGNEGADMGHWGVWGLSLCMVYLLEEMNNSNSLIRVRTHLTAAVYMVGMGCCVFLQDFRAYSLVAPAVMIACHLLFRTYQQYQPVTGTFHAFLCLGLGMLVYPRLVGFVPFFFFCMAAYLRTFTFRTFKAGLVGVLLPFWFLMAWTLYAGDVDFWIRLWKDVSHISLPGFKDYGMLTVSQLTAWGGLSLFSLVAVIRFLHTNYDDKLRTRMFFYIFILLHVFVQLLLIGMPQDFNALFGLLLACSAPLLAHFYALNHTRTAALLFVLMVCWLASLPVIALWIQ